MAKFLFVAFVLVLALSLSFADTCTCSSCSECTQSLGDSYCSRVELTQDILSTPGGDCISFSAGFNHKMLDCKGYTIGATGNTGTGIVLDYRTGNSISNCVIQGFEAGISGTGAKSNTLSGLDVEGNTWGVYFDSSSDNTITGSRVFDNSNSGIRLSSSSNTRVEYTNLSSNGQHGVLLENASSTSFKSVSSEGSEYGFYIDLDSLSTSFDGGSACRNSQYDIYEDSGDPANFNIACDYSSPDGLCSSLCRRPPANGTCTSQCSENESRCIQGKVQACVRNSFNGCFEWGSALDCPEGKMCFDGECIVGCTSECSQNETRCRGDQVQMCNKAGGCYFWSAVGTSCPAGQSCYEGKCRPKCTDQCSANSTRCEGELFQSCMFNQSSGCYLWSDPAKCSNGTCQNGTCAIQCSKEGESSPYSYNCCPGLTLLPAKDAAGSGPRVCSSKCGNGVCDNLTESENNCPADCRKSANQKPEITLVSPKKNDSTHSPLNFVLNASDGSNDTLNCTLIVDGTPQLAFYAQSGAEFQVENYSLAAGGHSWGVICEDKNGLSGISESNAFSVTSSNLQPPEKLPEKDPISSFLDGLVKWLSCLLDPGCKNI